MVWRQWTRWLDDPVPAGLNSVYRPNMVTMGMPHLHTAADADGTRTIAVSLESVEWLELRGAVAVVTTDSRFHCPIPVLSVGFDLAGSPYR